MSEGQNELKAPIFNIQSTDENQASLTLPDSNPYPAFYQVDPYGMPLMPPMPPPPDHQYGFNSQAYAPYAIPYHPGNYHPDSLSHMQHLPQSNASKLEEDDDDENRICPHEDCGLQFKKQSTYHQHLKTHTNTPKPFLCRVCSFSFSRSHDLKRHEYIHSKDKPFLCDGCQRGFSRRDALKRHLDSMRSRPGGCGNVKRAKDSYP